MEADRIEEMNIEEQMQQSYLDYAMSVIVGRALPDVRDGLKPVHRRILYAMHELKNHAGKPYKKAARLVGEVIGKYHPHGDAAVYDTIVRLAQDFSLRYPLVDGQGNFGSIDGDAAAAMRYTEVRMSPLAHDMLTDIERETVEFGPNYDESLTEPLVLPTRLPNLLVNGSSGIAVGMSTTIPPHNLGEIVEALIALVDEPAIQNREVMKIIQGPDFPTAGCILGREGLEEAYETGRGIIKVRAQATVETPEKGSDRIVITEIPYQIKKSKIVEEIAELVRDKVIEGVSDLRDESSRDGMRVVIDLQTSAVPEVLLNTLYKRTSLQTSFGINMLAIVHGQPRVLSIKELLQHFIEHRREVVLYRTEYELAKAEERVHILEGLMVALEHLDEFIAIIRKSKSPSVAEEALRVQYKLSSPQAQAVLNLRLQRLTALEREKIVTELKEKQERIVEYREILEHEARLLEVIKEELAEIREKYADERRTVIIEDHEEIQVEDLIVEEDMVITCSHRGYLKRDAVSRYRKQRRGGKGRIGMSTRDNDFVEHLFIASTHHHLLFFTDTGRVYRRKVHELPEQSSRSRGQAAVNLLELDPGEKIASLLAVKDFDPVETYYIFSATAHGFVKKTLLSDYANIYRVGIIAQRLREGDRIIAVHLTDGRQEVVLGTQNGLAIRFSEQQVRPTGRNTFGVYGIRLQKNDRVVGMDTVGEEARIFSVTERGFGKLSRATDYRTQSRSGKGLINLRVTEKTGCVVVVHATTPATEAMLITSNGKLIRIHLDNVPVFGRRTQGVKLIDLAKNDAVVAVAKISVDDETLEEH